VNAEATTLAAPLIALVGNPNCGKTALFNSLTGSRQKVANYAGVTVERKEGSCYTPSGRRVRGLDRISSSLSAMRTTCARDCG
jgi:ferrous iron transport protein B